MRARTKTTTGAAAVAVDTREIKMMPSDHSTEMEGLPTLYAKSTKGKLGFWRIGSCHLGYITTHWGEVDGQGQSSSVQAKGKNIGRSNETTPAEQAALEAQSKWAKKRKAKYFLTPEDAMGTLNIKPMRAYSLDKKREARLEGKGPFAVQRKYDGVRCMAYRRDDGTVRLMSRGGEDYDVPHIAQQIESTLDAHEVLDGELYLHGHLLQDIRHLIAEGDERIEFHVYDMTELVEVDGNPWTKRSKNLAGWFKAYEDFCPNVVKVPTDTIPDIKTAWGMHDVYVSEGYEGGILRLLDGTYKMGSKSTKLLKLKEFEDAEFTIVGHSVSKDGVLLWECEQEEGLVFEARPVGSMEYRAQLLKEAEAGRYVGQQLTVKFKGRSADNKPLFGVGKGIRPAKDMD